MNEQKLTMTVDEAAAQLGIGRGLAYEKCRTGEIPTVRIGRRLLVSRVVYGISEASNRPKRNG